MSNGRLKVVVGCEYSGRVRDAFLIRGHDAISVDILPTDSPGPHHQGDLIEFLDRGVAYDIGIFHPPCTYLAASGLHWNKRKPGRADMTEDAIKFVLALYNHPWVRACAVENPVGCLSTRWRKPDQIIQPWQFGEDASKKTCLWLRNLPLLTPTNIITKARYANQTASGQNNLGPSEDRWKLRSTTYPGIANAMADQWG